MIENYVEIKLNPCRKDLTGMKFGKLTVIKPVKTKNSKYSQWLCKCDCGNEVVAYSYKLLAGRVKSCGCLMTNIHPYKVMQQENAELKAENARLKENYIKLCQQKYLDDVRLQKGCTVLQKIKKYIARICKEECGYVQKKRCPDCDCRYGAILDLITKIEEE